MPIQGIVSPLPPVLTLDADYATNRTIESDTGPDVICARASSGMYMNASGVWASAAVDVARFHHYYINGQIVSGGLLREPQRTNLLLHTASIDNAAWQHGGLTATSAAAAAPDGGAAWRLTDSIDGSATFHRIYQSINIVDEAWYSFSMFCKPEGLKTIAYNTNAGVTNTVYFNMEEETILDFVPAHKKIMKRLPNGWYYLAVIGQAESTGSMFCQWWTAAPIPAGGESVQYQGAGESLLVWSPQAEAGKSPSTPIVSGATAATRAQDIISITSNDFDAVYNESGGILVVGTRTSEHESDIEYARIDDLSDSNAITLGRNSSGQFFAKVRTNSTDQLSATVGHLYNDLEPVLAGVTFKANRAIGGIKGVLTSPSASVTVPVNPSRLLLGSTINGCISSIQMYQGQYRSFTSFQALLGEYSFVEPDTLDALGNAYTDVQEATVTAAYAKLKRIHVDASLYHKVSPGARIRLQTTVPDVKFLFEYDDPQAYTYQGVFSVLINGAESDQYIAPTGATGEFTVEVLGTGSRLVELICPMSGSYRFKGLQRFGSGTITGATARPTKTIACFGDSITHGFFAARVTKSWPFLLGELQNAEVINVGYGSEVVGADVGTEAGEIGAEITIYCIGYNNFTVQTPLATFKTAIQKFVDDFRAENPTGKLYLGGPFYTPNTNTLTPAMYRTQVAEVVTSEADANTILLDTLNAASNNSGAFPDNVHPSNSGSFEIATAFDTALG